MEGDPGGVKCNLQNHGFRGANRLYHIWPDHSPVILLTTSNSPFNQLSLTHDGGAMTATLRKITAGIYISLHNEAV